MSNSRQPTRPGYNSPVQLPNLLLRRLVRDYALALAFWLAASLLVSWQMFILERRFVPLSYHDMFLLYAARYLSVALLTPPIFYVVNRWPVTGAVLRRTAAYGCGYLPFTAAFALIRWSVLPPWLDESMTWGPRTFQTLVELMYDSFADLLLVYLAVVVAAHAYAYFVRGQRQEIEHLRLRQSLAQSELQMLRAQLHPHFLFNTLQGVSTLIDTDRATAQNMLLTLAGLLRKALQHGSTDLLPFREELAFVEAYLQLERLRLGRRLEVRWQIGPEVAAALIPQLLLQPLIENALVHGIATATEGGWIEVEARQQQMQLLVTIRNSVAGTSQPGSGVGIANTRARLKYLYGADASFDFEILGGNVAVARLVVPAFTRELAHAANG